jgi:hypothetical protein
MNWKLIFTLSLFGILMAFASVFGLTGKMEPLIWLVIFIVYGVIIAKQAPGKYFMHAFMVSVINGVWIGIIHGAMFSTYAANNPEMMAQSYDKIPHFATPAIEVVIFGPIFGAVFGIISGLITLLIVKIMKPKKALG